MSWLKIIYPRDGFPFLFSPLEQSLTALKKCLDWRYLPFCIRSASRATAIHSNRRRRRRHAGGAGFSRARAPLAESQLAAPMTSLPVPKTTLSHPPTLPRLWIKMMRLRSYGCVLIFTGKRLVKFLNPCRWRKPNFYITILMNVASNGL